MVVHRGLVAVSVERLIETGADVTYARRLVRWLRASALSGRRFDSDVFDAAVLGHRRLKRRARAALEAWTQSQRPTPTRIRRSERISAQRAA